MIQQATQIALEKGITVKKSLKAVRELRQRGVDIPLILMGYYNPMLAYGLEKFVRDARKAGADGFIALDLPMEEADEFMSVVRADGVIVGSACVKAIGGSGNPVETATEFAKSFSEAL